MDKKRKQPVRSFRKEKREIMKLKRKNRRLIRLQEVIVRMF